MVMPGIDIIPGSLHELVGKSGSTRGTDFVLLGEISPEISSRQLYMYSWKGTGPRIEHCGTSLVISRQSDS